MPPSPRADDDRPLVVVTVGTDHHPFDRVVGWTDRWAADNPDVRVRVQHGHAAAPTVAEGAPLLPFPELLALLDEAVAVVSHGGPATLAQVRDAGCLPLCVPRDPALGEHVDDHQQRFARHQDSHGLVVHVTDEDAFRTHLDAALADPSAYAVAPDAVDAARTVRRFGAMVDALLDGDDATVERHHREAVADAAARTTTSPAEVVDLDAARPTRTAP